MSIKHGKLRPGRNLGNVFKIGHYLKKNRTQNRANGGGRSVQRRVNETSEYMQSINKLWSDAGHFKLQDGTLPGDPFSRILPKLQ